MRYLPMMGVALLLCCIAAPQISAQPTEGYWDSEDVDLWGINSDETANSDPISILEGTLDDHQENNTFQINTSADTVHNIRIEAAVDPILVEVRGDFGKIAEITGVHDQVALVSGEGSSIQIVVQSVSFNGSNPYQIHVQSVTGDATVNINPDFRNTSKIVASGYLHDTDSVGDIAIFKIGGNAPLNLACDKFARLKSARCSTEFDRSMPCRSTPSIIASVKSALSLPEYSKTVFPK